MLVSGESGTGKELIARTLHKQGANPLSPFVVADCANLSHDDFEKRLFGWSESALKHHIGIIESAANGTIFFDEICSVSPFWGK